MYSEYVPNIDLFISMHVLKEATQSSKIEGTKTNIEEALKDKSDLSEEKRNDWEEVQNWIGGASISDAVFIPPIHEDIASLMAELEKFVHNEEHKFPDLLKVAIMHYQFETIHPFLDGNGRVGRLMITLYLVEKNILKKPILYLSDFFERNRNLYYDNLMRVRTNNDIQQWLKFFLVGVIETAKSSINTFDQIFKLQREIDGKLQKLGSRASNARKVITFLYQRPLISAQKASQITGLTMPSSYKLIKELETLNILEEITGSQRGRQYWFADYINIFK